MVGPYSDERSINHAWFSMEHAGGLAEMVIEQIHPALFKLIPGIISEQRQEFKKIVAIRDSLHVKAMKRFLPT